MKPGDLVKTGSKIINYNLWLRNGGKYIVGNVNRNEHAVVIALISNIVQQTDASEALILTSTGAFGWLYACHLELLS